LTDSTTRPPRTGNPEFSGQPIGNDVQQTLADDRTVGPLVAIERLVDHWHAEANAMMDGMYTNLSTNTGVHAARVAALSEVVDALRPILFEAEADAFDAGLREALERIVRLARQTQNPNRHQLDHIGDVAQVALAAHSEVSRG